MNITKRHVNALDFEELIEEMGRFSLSLEEGQHYGSVVISADDTTIVLNADLALQLAAFLNHPWIQDVLARS